MTISDQKAAARKQAFAARKLAYGEGLDGAANAHLQRVLVSLEGADVVAAYMSIRTEVSPLATMARLCEQGKTVCVPVIQGEGQALKFARWTPGTVMVDGPFGASVPEAADYVVPDVVVTPLVAFDDRGYRLGYGGGFYDRSFEEISAQKPVIAVGFAYDAQRLDEVPTEATDHRLDMMVTETGVRTF